MPLIQIKGVGGYLGKCQFIFAKFDPGVRQCGPLLFSLANKVLNVSSKVHRNLKLATLIRSKPLTPLNARTETGDDQESHGRCSLGGGRGFETSHLGYHRRRAARCLGGRWCSGHG